MSEHGRENHRYAYVWQWCNIKPKQGQGIKTSRMRGGISTSAAVRAFSPCCICVCVRSTNNKKEWLMTITPLSPPNPPPPPQMKEFVSRTWIRGQEWWMWGWVGEKVSNNHKLTKPRVGVFGYDWPTTPSSLRHLHERTCESWVVEEKREKCTLNCHFPMRTREKCTLNCHFSHGKMPNTQNKVARLKIHIS